MGKFKNYTSETLWDELGQAYEHLEHNTELINDYQQENIQLLKEVNELKEERHKNKETTQNIKELENTFRNNYRKKMHSLAYNLKSIDEHHSYNTEVLEEIRELREELEERGYFE